MLGPLALASTPSATPTVGVTVAVLTAAVLHAVWNALAHAFTDKLVGVAVLSAGFVVGGLVALPWVGVPARASWPALLASSCVHVLYNLSLMRSYRLGAFNQVYPLARGMSPWTVALAAMVVVDEHLSAGQLAGVVVVSVGLGCLVCARGRPRREELPAVAAAVVTGLLIATYTVLDGVGVRRAEGPLAYAAWLFVLHGAVVVVLVALHKGPSVLLRDIESHWRIGAVAGTCAVAAYGLVLVAQTRGSLAAVAALRETSVIVGAIIGAVVFKEPFGRWRTAATVIVVAGIALLNLA
ncbi:DMT family transporter [Thermasporomyces composti]|uniref:EamA-like transporter family protein n=1 Tax=Thermasporomyces composti TaxID=696763 RepID=A0A3D9V8G9_THECX|nr:DMT family transporter [Thermasporomyces composti]REF37769.1 EamA-like transporter family protein [Thermasporomyces composti]